MSDLQKLERALKEEFGENMSVQYGTEHEHLGMSLDVSSGKYCAMTMSKYIENLVTDVGVDGDRVADYPASVSLFAIPCDQGKNRYIISSDVLMFTSSVCQGIINHNRKTAIVYSVVIMHTYYYVS